MGKINCIGIIAEDNSDFESLSVFIKRLTGRDNLSFKKMLSQGCGKLKNKAFRYSQDLYRRGCDVLIIVHDLDRNNLNKLRASIQKELIDNPFSKYYICIPIEEIEAWFLSDPDGIKRAMKLHRSPKITGMPEDIHSPKEKLGRYIYTCSNKERTYINTAHNQIIALEADINLIKRKCSSFKELCLFLENQQY